MINTNNFSNVLICLVANYYLVYNDYGASDDGSSICNQIMYNYYSCSLLLLII